MIKKCDQCQSKIAVIKDKNFNFCSNAHRKLFWDEQKAKKVEPKPRPVRGYDVVRSPINNEWLYVQKGYEYIRVGDGLKEVPKKKEANG